MNDNGKHFRDNLSIRRARRLPASMSIDRTGITVALVLAVVDWLSAPPIPPDLSYTHMYTYTRFCHWNTSQWH